ncbi:TLR adapter interacting with SLC15A4 on the lysosome [Ambystoma mexicanum]|uniref:TLR adapter interacting with SLC15A4 on the lysosome n=1 Tax=Ambystoma mexicanum TaxID=8296 RepID=UPI0037E8223F
MLSEGYLCGIPDWSEEASPRMVYQEVPAVGNAKEMTRICGFEYPSLALSKDPMKRLPYWDGPQESNRSSLLESQTSPAVEFSGDSNLNRDMYLVPPSCKSLYINYNDLHIAGDQVMPMDSVMTDFSCDSSFQFCEGPFLESSQIPPTAESVAAHAPEPLLKHLRGDSAFWRGGSGRDRSLMKHPQPLSNAVLNEYLEQKVVDLYQQCLMDRMDNGAAPDQLMASELIMSSVERISMQISREQDMDSAKAKDMVISCLLRLASGRTSAEISTPNLQISTDDNTQ